jgi:hypothetical protein
VQIRKVVLVAIAALLAAPVVWYAWAWLTFPSDRTPEGAYYRIAKAVNRGKPEEFFAYLETPAQHASYTIRNYRREALQHIRRSYPEPERSRLLATYAAEADAADGSDLFAMQARRRRWLDRLRRDLSGIRRVEMRGERASVETVRGTRYPMRRRENGIWGLTLFTADLVTEAERAARDLELIKTAAADYDRVRALEATRRP